MKYSITSMSDEVIEVNVASDISVTINQIMFDKGRVSMIEIHRFEGEEESHIMVHLYLGNICMATWVVKEVVLEEERYSRSEGETIGRLYGYRIRLPQNWDK